MDEAVFDIDGLAEYLKVEPKTVQYLSDTKRLPYFKVGRHIRFRRSAVIKWAEMQEISPEAQRF